MSLAASTAVAERAERIYAERLQARLESLYPHEFVAIEPDSGDFFLGATLSDAVRRAKEEHPSRLSFVIRIGSPTAIHLGVLAP